LANITLAKEQVLAGDRQTGGTVSPELLTLASAETKQTSPTDLSSSEQVEEIKREEDLEHPIDTSDRAYSFFVQEAPELLQIIESGLLTIKEERTTAKIHEIMRAAHSLKGGAATVGLEAIKTIAHKLEDIFKCLYNQEVEIDTNLESWLLEGYDCLSNPLTEQINTGSYHPQQALDQADRVWAKIETVLGDTLKRAGDYLPSSSDLGVDIVASMFEVDVEQELQRLRQVVSSPDSYPLAAELRATLEVFAGFGEMLNLPGFAEIAHNGLIALEKNPHRPLEIIRLIINDVETARNLVLKGDRHRGGEPSEALLSLAEGERSSPKNHPSLEDVFGEGKETDPHELLAEEKMEVPSLEEIFGDEAEITELMTTDNTEEEDRFAPSLEKVFGIDLDGDQLVQIYEELETEGQEEL
jgi:chemotaxis family two-component system sensor histidine kinase/response regulator PixL